MIVKMSIFHSWMPIALELFYTHGFDSFVTKYNVVFFSSYMPLLILLNLLKAERKKYEKETEKYYSSLEKLLNMSAKKKEPQLQEVFILARTLRQICNMQSGNS